jgi:hypothetical protein
MTREPAAFVALTLSACTTVTTVRVAPDEVLALADMAPDEQRKFEPLKGPAMTARGEDEVRLLVSAIEPGSARVPPVTQAPWGKLYTLRMSGSFVALRPADHGETLSLPAGELTGAELKMNRYSASKTADLAAILAGVIAGALSVAIIVVIWQAGQVGGG